MTWLVWRWRGICCQQRVNSAGDAAQLSVDDMACVPTSGVLQATDLPKGQVAYAYLPLGMPVSKAKYYMVIDR